MRPATNDAQHDGHVAADTTAAGRPAGDDDTPPALEVEDLAFAYPDGSEALSGIDLRVPAGERVAVLGPNGAGKTTLALHLNGIHRAARGRVTVAGTTLEDRTLPELRRRVGLVFQDPDDQLFMPTVREDVGFGPANLGLRGDELRERVVQALAAVGCAELAGRAPHHLSGGERRRVAIATVLAMEPDLLVFDEPTSNLDPASRRELVAVLRSLAVTQLIVTHDLPLVLELCPRTVIIDGGRVVADGGTVALLSDTELLAAHRLELPFGLDAATVRALPSPR
jgi:cobalt/nickel transport system ATP-binding protein